MSKFQDYIGLKFTGNAQKMPGKVGLRPFAGTAAVVSATVISGGLPLEGTDAPVAPTSQISEVYSEVQLLT